MKRGRKFLGEARKSEDYDDLFALKMYINNEFWSNDKM